MNTNRVVVLLTPVFVGLSGWLTGLAAKYLPGAPTLNEAEIAALMVTGAGAAFGVAAKWLHGWQQHEAQRAEARLIGRAQAHEEADALGEPFDFAGSTFQLVPVEQKPKTRARK